MVPECYARKHMDPLWASQQRALPLVSGLMWLYLILAQQAVNNSKAKTVISVGVELF